MDEAAFWNLIEQAKADSGGDDDKQVGLLVERLAALSTEDIVTFALLFDTMQIAAYTWELWGAGYLIERGMGNDGFTDFRAWLIAQGKDIYYITLQNPDYLAQVVPVVDDEWGKRGNVWLEDMNYVAAIAYEEKTGLDFYDAVQNHPWISHPQKPAGHKWTDDDLPKLFPLLWAKFGRSKA